HDEQVLRGVVLHARDGAELASVDVADGEALELAGVPGVRVFLRLLLRVDGELEVDAAQGLGVGAVGDLLEGRVPAVLLEAGAGDGESALASVLGHGEGGAGLQALLGLVRAQGERDLAAQPVGAADGGDDDVEGAHERPSWSVPSVGAAGAPTTALESFCAGSGAS